MDRIAAMRVFTTVADAGSLSAAGRRLKMPLATVSRHLSALEEQLGVRLLTRTTRQLSLTEPGRHYLESCRRILSELEAAELALAGQHGGPRGEIAITAPTMFSVRIGVLPDSSLMATRVGSIRLVTCASPTYLAKHGTPETPAGALRP